ncbi:PAS domain-containing sensor histidine kinase [Longitalea arenae]|uniref:PAS domain-containing sensor histidine kinase n=1 Tax=Longitalea arenae TaxID=2812558 RepID=UPI001967B69D|nr:ATP-binding protein [Longitalea arenae]
MAGTQQGASGFIQKIPAGVISFTDDGNITYINDWLLKLLQYKSSDLSGKKIEHILTLASRIFYQTHLFPLIKLEKKIEEIFLSLKSNEAKEIPVLVYGHREEEEGHCINTCVIVAVWQRKKYEEELLKAKQRAEKIVKENTELTIAQKELESKTKLLDKQILRLRQINRELTAFNKVISHDLQEPIRKISLFTQSIKRAFDTENESVNNYYQKIDASINRLVLLTQCLAQFVSLTGNTEQIQVLSLKEVVMESLALARSTLAFEDIVAEIEDLPHLQGYLSQIKLLFYELIKNSIQYRDKNRKLRISVKGVISQYNDYKVHEDKYRYVDFVRIEYADNGIGFSNEYNEYVFEIFKRLHLDVEGLGFGLTICKKVVDNHFGEIFCHSKPGVGTTYTILLPVNMPDFSLDV